MTLNKLNDLVLNNLNWTAIGVILSFFCSLCIYYFTNRYKRSEFYLQQIKTYLKNAINLLENGRNNNIKWHQAIQLLINPEPLLPLSVKTMLKYINNDSIIQKKSFKNKSNPTV